MCGITAKPPHRDIHKTALGATQHVQWSYFAHIDQALHTLKEKGFIYVPWKPRTKPSPCIPMHCLRTRIWRFVWDTKYKEFPLAPPKMPINCSIFLNKGKKRSLNVAVATGIALWHAFSGTEAEIDR